MARINKQRGKWIVQIRRKGHPNVYKSFIDLIPDDPRQWTDDEADIMALGNLFAQRKGNVGDVDELLIEAFGGNRDKQHEAYELHHTSLSDPGTTDRLKKIIP